jgi:hypothetical protein
VTKISRDSEEKIVVWIDSPCHVQGCQMVYLNTKKANYNGYLKACGWIILVHFMASGYFSSFGFFFPVLVFLYQEKSGNPDHVGLDNVCARF